MKTAASIFLTAGVVLATAAQSFAVSDGYPPTANPDASPVNWFAVIYAVVFAIAVCVVCFKNSKRTFLD